jgi:hypothetical protein
LTESPFLQISGEFGIPNPFQGEIADSFSQTPSNKQQATSNKQQATSNKQQQSIRSTKSFIVIHHSSSSTLFTITINNDSTLLWFMMAAPLS